MEPLSYTPIGYIRCCFREKFGVPRQSLMVKEARAILKLGADSDYCAALDQLDCFTHVWVLFHFHHNAPGDWRPMIDPPRLSQSKKVGVFASRSPHRPNPIGLSVVKLEKIDRHAPGGIEIHLSGVDILDGTPVLDIKPYLPYADRVEEAGDGWAEAEAQRYTVEFSPESQRALDAAGERHPRLQKLITQMLEWDPRPMSQRRSLPIGSSDADSRTFAFRVGDADVHWQPQGEIFHVRSITLPAL